VSDIELPLTPSRVMDLLGIDDPEPSAHVAAAQAKPAAVAQPAAGGRNRALRAAGSVLLAAPPPAIFGLLLDPDALARVIPGCHALEALGPSRYRAEVTLGVGLVKARYSAEIELSDLEPPHGLRLSGSGSSTLGSVRGDGTVRLAEQDGGTRLDYDYGVEVSGKVAAVGSRMLESAARMVLQQLFEQLGRQAAGGGTPARAGWWRRLLRWLESRT
jgi:2-furoyl-CoA dehydrogenase large subunit